MSRTFYNPGVSRIPVAEPSAPQSLIDLKGPAGLKALDGLTLDGKDRAIVPSDLTGEILRVLRRRERLPALARAARR